MKYNYAKIIDTYRVVPRIIIIGYSVLLYQTTNWFMMLPDPSSPQSMFISTVVGAGAGVFGLYANSGTKWEK